MNRRTAAFISILALSGSGVAPAPASPKLADQILGRWRLVSIETRDDASKPWEKSYGNSPIGALDYSAEGWMSAQIARLPRPRFASGKDREPTPEEAREAYLGYAAYFGTYSVDEVAKIITHHVQGSLMPSFAGTDQKRPATLEGNRLTLSDEKTFRVVWERPKS